MLYEILFTPSINRGQDHWVNLHSQTSTKTSTTYTFIMTVLVRKHWLRFYNLSPFQTIITCNQQRPSTPSSPSLARSRNNTLERLKSALTHSNSAPSGSHAAAAGHPTSLNANSPTPPSTPRKSQARTTAAAPSTSTGNGTSQKGKQVGETPSASSRWGRWMVYVRSQVEDKQETLIGMGRTPTHHVVAVDNLLNYISSSGTRIRCGSTTRNDNKPITGTGDMGWGGLEAIYNMFIHTSPSSTLSSLIGVFLKDDFHADSKFTWCE